ncbi:hypothetical protein ACFGVR_17630 [Mucilaginibacter sp. AW1-3]
MKTIQQLIFLAGVGQLCLVTGSVFIPRILNWRAELTKVQPIIKKMFWVYAFYILTINLCFGLVSVFAYADMTNGSKLATLVTGFIAVYWISRLLIQFLVLDRTSFPKGLWLRIGETALVTLFVFLAAVYSCAWYHNL